MNDRDFAQVAHAMVRLRPPLLTDLIYFEDGYLMSREPPWSALQQEWISTVNNLADHFGKVYERFDRDRFILKGCLEV